MRSFCWSSVRKKAPLTKKKKKKKHLVSAWLAILQKPIGVEILELAVQIDDPFAALALLGRAALHQGGGLFTCAVALEGGPTLEEEQRLSGLRRRNNI